jgi:predicted transposase YbfD/YdcC
MQSKLSGVTDKRRHDKGNIRHKLVSILVMAFTAVLCGFKDYEEMEQFCKEKAEWFRKFLEMPYGVPDAITFYRVLRVVDPVELAGGLQEWLYEVKLEKDYEINIDGKTMRGSIRGNFRGCHIVSAWVGAGYLSLGQVKTDAHSNEITAIPELLDLIDIKGARITIDAEGCQKDIAKKIIEKGGNYTLAVKENQPMLYEEIRGCFEWEEDDKWADIPVDRAESEVEKAHGRIEKRECAVITNIDWLKGEKEWEGVQSIIKMRSHVSKWDTETGVWQSEKVYDRYFISSLALSAKEMGPLIRRHWSIENNLHWVLDMDFGEDDDMKKTLHAPENMNVLRKMALTCLANHKVDPKKGVKHHMIKALLNDDYRLSLLFDPK